ncbi:polysaccharide deacetylase family protein [Paenibacillus sp. KN14-4R]|uniref:polysaccharide deacetylase family protein n=1 Tax=Paenibacillus sp. KN14-4R TaxID=3445773 RepID=UPI003FA079CC
MIKRLYRARIVLSVAVVFLVGCSVSSGQAQKGSISPTVSPTSSPVSTPFATPVSSPDHSLDRQKIIDQFADKSPTQWGEKVTGVRTRLQTKDKAIALTFDACGGGPAGNGYDKELIDYLTQEKIPATLFINARWIDANPELFQRLAANPLFELENHGHEHRPLSVTGKSIYNIRGTKNVGEVIDEVQMNADKIEALTGRRPQFFRSGTAYYDEIAVKVVNALGMQVVNFNVLGDAGATFNAEQVDQALSQAKSGSIVLCHMNHPEKSTAEGVMKAVPKLKKTGVIFVKLSAYPLE